YYACQPSIEFRLAFLLCPSPLAIRETARKCSRTFLRACPINKRELLSYSNRLYCVLASLLLALACVPSLRYLPINYFRFFRYNILRLLPPMMFDKNTPHVPLFIPSR